MSKIAENLNILSDVDIYAVYIPLPRLSLTVNTLASAAGLKHLHVHFVGYNWQRRTDDTILEAPRHGAM